MKVVERIYALMESRGVAATELSKSTGINASTLTQWKKGLQKPSVDAVNKLSDYFGVTTDFILGKTDRSNPPILDIPDVLKDVQAAFHRGGIEDLTQEEVDKIAEFAQFVRSQRKD